jgi:isopropylmalate/homocitrate/citramalate synthase
MDSTLREGEETPGTHLTPDQKVRLAHALEETGFNELEVGYAGIIDDHRLLVRDLKRAGVRARLASHTRTYGKEGEWQEEIERALEVGCEILTFVGFSSEATLRSTPWLAEEALAERFADCIEYARSRGAVVAFSLAGSDLFRTPLVKVGMYYGAAAAAGAERLYVSDGTGTATPEAIAFFTRFISDVGGGNTVTALHLHNTFGLATANALAGVTAGAAVADTCILGLGDGAGITAAEEIVLALEVLYGVSTGIDLDNLIRTCKLVQDVFGIRLAPHKPFLGENIFRHQLDSHVAAILRAGWQSWEVVRAEALGRERRLELGYGKLRRGRSGAIQAKIEQMGLSATDDQFDGVFAAVREIVDRKVYATEEDLEAVILGVLGQ